VANTTSPIDKQKEEEEEEEEGVVSLSVRKTLANKKEDEQVLTISNLSS